MSTEMAFYRKGSLSGLPIWVNSMFAGLPEVDAWDSSTWHLIATYYSSAYICMALLIPSFAVMNSHVHVPFQKCECCCRPPGPRVCTRNWAESISSSFPDRTPLHSILVCIRRIYKCSLLPYPRF